MRRKIRVGLDIRDMRIARTGARTYLEELMREFKKGHPDFEFFYLDTTTSVYTGKNKLLKLLEQCRFLVYKQVSLPLKAWSLNCDYLICTDFFVPLISLGYKSIPVFHDAFFWEYPTHYNKYWLLTFRTLCVEAAKRSAFIITPTEFAKLRILYFLRIPSERIIPMHEGPKTFPASANNNLPTGLEKAGYLLHVGVFERRKNLVRLVEAFAQLRQSGSDLKLVLIGQFSPKQDMDDSSAVLKAIEDNQLSEYVVLPGYVIADGLPAYYNNALAYVFPSINEGFGLPILEAFHHGIPVLVANNSCLPEVGGDAVITFDPFSSMEIYNAIQMLIKQPELREILIAKGYKRLQQFSWEKTAKRILETMRLHKKW